MRSLLARVFHGGQPASDGSARRRPRRRAAALRAERLEQRLALTINVFSPAAGTSFAPWFVITSDNADDVYVKQVATVPQDLLIADNSSFNDYQSLGAFHAEGTLWNGIGRYTTMYVTNGTRVSAGNVSANDSNGFTTSEFTLATKVADKDTTNVGVIGNVTGTVTYAGNSWDFTNNGVGNNLTFTLTTTGPTSDPAIIKPTAGVMYVAPGGTSGVRISWNNPPAAATGIAPPTLSSVKYDITTAAPANAPKTYTEFGLQESYGPNPNFTLPVTQRNPGGIVPGTLTGTLTIDGSSNEFRMSTLFPPITQPNSLLFANGAGTPATTGTFKINAGTPYEKTVNVKASVDYDSGFVSLKCTAADGTAVDPGAVSISANYAVYNQDATANAFTFAPGLTFDRELYVDLLTPGSQVKINNPVVQSQAVGTGEISLRATTIDFNAQAKAQSYLDIGPSVVDRNARLQQAQGYAIVDPTGVVSAIGIPAGAGGQGYDDTAQIAVTISGGGGTGATAYARSTRGVISSIVITSGGSGYTSLPTITIAPPSSAPFPALGTALAEQVNFNAAVAAPQYDIRVADDPGTANVTRGRVFVSATGSLSGALSATQATVATAAGSLYLQADTSDVYVEGTIYIDTQSYLFRSPSALQALAPFVFTTTSPRSGVRTGLIRGTTLAVTLGNDIPTPEQGSVALNTVDLQTQIASLRVTAATQKGAPLSGPFPYDLTINEVDDISIDAVAASSRPISLNAAGNIAFTAALATAGDLSIAAGRDFTLSAPVSTSRGAVAVTAANVTINNSLRVLDPAVDDYRDDIVLTASAGSLNLTGVVSGVNNVRLTQRNKAGVAGSIAGQARVIGRGLVVQAEGGVNLLSDVDTVDARAGGDFALSELNDVTISSLRAPGFVTLQAGGIDPGLSAPKNSIALKATVFDAAGLQASAPKGSVDIDVSTPRPLTIGNFAAIGAGTAPPMLAAGSVKIRSRTGPVAVADAPLAGGAALAVRLATTADLGATFSYNTPGIFASTLTGSKQALTIDGQTVRVGDRILVKDQATKRENGVYTVTKAGDSKTNWVLTRATDADTTVKLPGGAVVQVKEGTAAGMFYGISYTSTFGTSPIAVTTITNRADAIHARVATTAALSGTYSSNAKTITGPGAGVNLVIDGASLAVGDRVLVRLGVAGGTGAENGVYEVTDDGTGGNPWQLTRAQDASGNDFTVGVFATDEGSFRAAVTGQAFLLGYNSLGKDAMTVAASTPGLNIGTDAINAGTTFVVSSTAGTNDAAGSLGKMLLLRQANNGASTLNPAPIVDFRFASLLPALNGAPAGVIRLAQELPTVSTRLAIDGARRFTFPGMAGSTPTIVVDGSRIVTSKTGSPAGVAAEINGFEFTSGSGQAGSTAGGSVANLTIGGFAKGAAVKINGAAGVLVNKLVIGLSETGERLTSKYGVLATGTTTGSTIAGCTIASASTAGISLASGATDATVAGTTVGLLNQNNANGIEVTAGNAGTNRLGVNPLAVGTYKASTTLNGTTLTLPANVDLRRVFLGQTIAGAGIQAGTIITAINGSVITLSNRMTQTGSATLTFGQPGRNVVQYNLSGIVLNAGTNTLTNTDVANNAYVGVDIGGGTQTIGASPALSASSNAIYGNGSYGVRFLVAVPKADLPKTNLTGSKNVIQGNYFGSVVAATSGLANGLRDVFVEPNPLDLSRPTAEALGFNPAIPSNKTTQLDRFGNQYVRPPVASAGGPSAGPGGGTSKQPWRQR